MASPKVAADIYVGAKLYDSDCMAAQLNQKLVEAYTAIDETGRFISPPSTDDELYEFVHLAYGIRLPRKVITEGHKSPFQFVSDLFFERVKNALGFANRTGGKTYTTALLNHLDMVFKHGCEIASAGAVKDQAARCYRYFVAFNELPWFIRFTNNFALVTGKRFVVSSIQSKTEFGNNARLEIITGTETGFRGPHPNKARIDEIDELDWSVLQTGLSMAQTTGGIRGQNVFTSTRQKSDGSMNRLLSEASSKGIEVYEWNVWETLERCDRKCINDEQHGTCPIFAFCQGRAHECDGFYKIDDFIDRVRLLDEQKFATEWLNEQPQRDKMVYPQFSLSKHVMTPERLEKLTGFDSPQWHWYRIAGIDFGSSPGHPFVYLKLTRLPTHEWLVFYEYVAEQKLLRDHAAAIQCSPFYSSSEIKYADWDAQDRKELAALGISSVPAIKGNNSVSVGLDKVSEYLYGYPNKGTPELYVWHTCRTTIYEFQNYRWPMRADGTINKTGRPEQENDHTMDALRYALYSHYSRPKHGYRLGKI
jgi:hypothetical protein